MSSDQQDFIDIEKVIAGKNPRLLKILPGFVIRYIKRIVHQQEINDFIRRHGHKHSLEFVDAIITEFGVKVTVEGLENIPESGGAVIASNHPLGGLDAMALMHVIGKVRTDQKFIVNDVLLNLKNLSDIFIGVNKHGKNSAGVLDQIDNYYAGNGLVLIFPAGLVSRKGKSGIIRDLSWRKSFISKAKKFQKPVIPVHIEGNNSSFFYNLARLRSTLKIKSNIEMFYLIDEMYSQKGRRIHIQILQPLQPGYFTSQRSDREWADHVQDIVYSVHPQKL